MTTQSNEKGSAVPETRKPLFDIRETKSKVLRKVLGYHYVLLGANGEVMNTSETYTTEANARRAVNDCRAVVKQNPAVRGPDGRIGSGGAVAP